VALTQALILDQSGKTDAALTKYEQVADLGLSNARANRRLTELLCVEGTL
jgi:hypothetical protein